MHMMRLVEQGLARISGASKITSGVGDVADFVLSLKGIIDLAIQGVPQAALPWAGVCVGLQMLQNPAKATASNLTGIAYVISRMRWYCALAEHLLSKENVAAEDFETVLDQMENGITELYKALLQYQMKSVCSYYRHQGLVFLRNLFIPEEWDGDLKRVTDAETIVRNNATQFFQEQTRSSLKDLVSHAEGLEKLLGDIRQDLRGFILSQKDASRDQIETECRRDLRVVDPQHDMERIEKIKDELFDDAYDWILRTNEYAEFTNWDLDYPPRRLLWIKGHAGTGKTMLMIGLIRQLSHQPAALSPGLSFFFCQGTDAALNNATAVLRSLIWLLLLQQPRLMCHLLQKYKESGANLFKDKNAFFALSEALRNMLKDPQLSPVYLAVDALDECMQGRPDLIDLISTSLTLSPHVKWLISSRPEVDLAATLRDWDPNCLVELDTQRLEAPVNAYIDHKLTILNRTKGYSNSVFAQLAHEVRKRAENTFLWVALAFKVPEAVSKAHAVKVIQEMPPGLSELYNHMMARIEERHSLELQDCKTVLAVTSLAFRPLSILELSVLAGLDLEAAESAVKMCGSFFTITKGTVNLIHQSAQDYLEKNYHRLQPAGPAPTHREIIERSIDEMSARLRRNMYNLDVDSFLPENMTPPDPDPLARIRYSCIFWADHLCSVPSNLHPELLVEWMNDTGKVFGFLNKYLLRWLESLSLIGQLSTGLFTIRKILDVAQSQPNISPCLLELLKDAEKFVFSHRSIMERCPLQIYGSALVFSPTMSETRTRHWKERLPCIEMATGMKDRWDAHRQTLEGHSSGVFAIAFSPDGHTLVSGSEETTIRLWDTATGIYQQTLEGHSAAVTAIAFSPDGKILASASKDTTIRLWDIATGTHQQTLEGHSAAVTAIAFSPDGKILASASKDTTIRLWDIATGTHQQTLEGHSNIITAIAFLPDGKVLALGSEDTTIRLWDTATGIHQQTLEGHSSFITGIAFSPDGKILASGSWDKTIRLWDTATSIYQQTFERYSCQIDIIIISPDGNIVVSASDNQIRLWDTATGIYRQTLENNRWINVVVFSPDGNTLASASNDQIRLWDTATGAYWQTLEHRCRINIVAFSPDGNTLASASDDQIQLWDTATSICRQTLEHSRWISVVAFSSDGNTLVSASDNRIRLWDTATGACRQTLEYGARIKAVKFSRDGRHLETDRGLLSISSGASGGSGDQEPASGLLFVEEEWVTRDGKRLLWLPAEYRATRVAVRGNTVVLAHRLGRVTFFRFSFD
ncbi:hypothetical protein VTJ83DRAFT_2341 [Remersonia thermophila]|uniref:NACHT domain-containing protein n=1 Tax=Remersonia thermophila TaxID=72144 RepID=A0ABR4DII6_9PEZI